MSKQSTKYRNDFYAPHHIEKRLGDPSHYETLICRARFYDLLRKKGPQDMLKKWKTLLQDVIDNKDHKLMKLVAQGYLHILNGDHNLAVKLWNEYVDKNPTDSSGYHHRAHVRLLSVSQEDKESAVTDFCKGYDLLPPEHHVIPEPVVPDWESYVKIQSTGIMGNGVFAARDFKKGEQVLPFNGKRTPCLHHNYLYDLQIDERDVMCMGYPLRTVNHSCEPNTGIIDVKILIALRDIAKGEQIFYDYSTTIDDDCSWAIECLCGSKRCRGKIEDFVLMDPAVQDEYLDLGIVFPDISSRFTKLS